MRQTRKEPGEISKFNTLLDVSGDTRKVFRSLFYLTNREQKAVIVVLLLFMLGVAARYWHICMK